MAGFLPGFGRGGMTHSFLVTMEGAGRPEAGTTVAMVGASDDLMVEVGAGARAAGDSAEEEVDTVGGGTISLRLANGPMEAEG